MTLPLAVLLRALVADQQTGNPKAREAYQFGQLREFIPSAAAELDAHRMFAEFADHVAIEGGRALPGIWAPLSLAPSFFERAGHAAPPGLAALLGPAIKVASDAGTLNVGSLEAALRTHIP